MRLIARYVKPFRSLLGWALLTKAIAAFAELFIPYLLSYILDSAVPAGELKLIVFWGTMMIVCSLAAFLFNVGSNRLSCRLARDVTRNVRHDLFKATGELSARQQDGFTVPSLESRLSSDTYMVHSFMTKIPRVGIRAPILLIGGLVMTAFLDLKLTLILLAIVPFIFFVVYFVSKKGIPLYMDVQERNDDMVRIVREDTKGVRVIKALSRVDSERERFNGVANTLSKTERKAEYIMGISSPGVSLLLNLGMTAVIFVGAILISRDNGTKPGVIIAFLQYFNLITGALTAINRVFIITSKCSASSGRIEEVLKTKSEIVTYSKEQYPDVPSDSFLSFENVSFAYCEGNVGEDKRSLKNLSLDLPRGASLGIIGGTGAGKSTLVRLLLRFYDVTEGSIRLDGTDIRTISPELVRKRFGVALQNDMLFAGTVRENVDFHRGISDEELTHALRIAQASFVFEDGQGLDYPVELRGSNFSGGQRQRLLLARALAGKPEILILDDASSALDYQTDANLRRALAESFASTTRITVAQRVSSVMFCDRILVLENGEEIAFGTHSELMESCSLYREISESQMGGAILD